MNAGGQFNEGILHPNLCLGVVCAVRSDVVHVNMRDAGNPSGSYYKGSRYGRGEVSEFVVIEGQQNLLLGRIVEIRLPNSERQGISQSYSGSDSLDAVGHVQLLGSVTMDRLRVTAGVDFYPRLGDRVYSAPHSFLAAIPQLMVKSEDLISDVQLTLGVVNSTHESAVHITPERLFGRHCAILGATGGGKSWTTARVIEECMKFSSKMILIDATSEYRSLESTDVMHCHLGTPVSNANGSTGCSLPPTCFSETDFIALFEPSGKSQGPKLRAAMRSLRLAKIKSSLAPDGYIRKIDQPKADVQQAELDSNIAAQLDNPKQPFDVAKLPKQIEQECVYPEGFGTGKSKDPTKWGGADEGAFSYCLPIIARIEGVLRSRALECVFSSNSKPSVTTKIEEFLRGNEKLMRLCLGGIAYEYKAREVIANAIGRFLLEKARDGEFRKKPLLVLVDEAHSFLGRHIGGEDHLAKLDAFELIAKEGRKYGLNICLATQRPRDVTEGVLSQMGTLLVHRLTNDRDREVVERACGEIDRSATSFLPNLQPGEAALIGVDFPIPLTIQINKPTYQPTSDGPEYQRHWKNK